MPSGIENYDFQTVAGDTYFDGVKDLDGDGHYEVIMDVYFASGGSIDHCDATWPVIYAWTGDGYGDVSRDFKHYYEQQLAVLQKRNAAAEAEKERARQAAAGPKAPAWNCQPQAANGGESAAPASPGTKTGAGVSPAGVGVAHFCWPAPPPATLEEDRAEERRGLDCDKAEAAKLERFLGVSRDAGMSDAIKWANSDNPLDRSFAADIFADIGTSQAQEYLKTLSQDPNRSVAMSVKGWLGGAKPSATYPTLKGEFILLTPGYPPAN